MAFFFGRRGGRFEFGFLVFFVVWWFWGGVGLDLRGWRRGVGGACVRE